MKAYRRSSNLQQMALSMGAFTLFALLLDSGGLLRWSQRLELGPERTIAMPLTTLLHRALAWTGLERIRHGELLTLARIRWSDDPALLAEAHATTSPAHPSSAKDRNSPPTVAKNNPPPEAPPKPASRPPLRPTAGDPPLLTALPKLPPVEPGKTRTVALAGDSMMAVGLSSTLLREAPRYKDIALIKAFKSGTGLTRPEIFDWHTEYPAMVQSAHPDIVLVAIGANDGQGFEDDGIVYPFGTQGWKEIYQSRVQAYLDLLEADGATVVWLGLPPMKSDAYDARIALINRIDYAVVKASPQAIWFSTAGLVGDATGRFQDIGEVHGQPARLRQGDGIHLSDDGAIPIATKLLPWLALQQTTAPTSPKDTP